MDMYSQAFKLLQSLIWWFWFSSVGFWKHCICSWL